MKPQADDHVVRVVVADDHPIYREGLVRAFSDSGEAEVVGEAETGDEAMALIREHAPDVALLDFSMPGMSGSDIAAATRREQLPTRVLLVSANKDEAVVYHALQQGAAGFLPKESARSQIVRAVLDCANGLDVVAPQLVAGLAVEIRRRRDKPPVTTLSDRESEVLHRIAQGQAAVQIAKELSLSQSTVKTLIQRIYDKLGVTDRASAVAEAMRRKIID